MLSYITIVPRSITYWPHPPFSSALVLEQWHLCVCVLAGGEEYVIYFLRPDVWCSDQVSPTEGWILFSPFHPVGCYVILISNQCLYCFYRSFENGVLIIAGNWDTRKDRGGRGELIQDKYLWCDFFPSFESFWVKCLLRSLTRVHMSSLLLWQRLPSGTDPVDAKQLARGHLHFASV